MKHICRAQKEKKIEVKGNNNSDQWYVAAAVKTVVWMKDYLKKTWKAEKMVVYACNC